MNRKHLTAALSAALCLSGAFMIPAKMPENNANAAATVTIGYYTEVPEFQSGSSETERKSGYAYEYYQVLAGYTGWNYNYVYGSFDEVLDALSKGKVDMVAGISSSCKQNGFRLTPYRIGTENSASADLPGVEDNNFYIAVSSSKPEIFDALLSAQKQINEKNPALCEKLSVKYFTAKSAGKQSGAEKKWLSSHSTILIGYLDNYMPYSDKDDERNEADGIMADLFDSIAKSAGKSISAVKYSTYADLYDALENGKIDAMFPAYRDLWRLEHENTVSTCAVVTDRMKLIAKNSDIVPSKAAIMTTSPVEAMYVNDNFPGVEMIHFNSFDSCIKAVRKGAADCFIVEENVLGYWKSDGNELSGLEVKDIEPDIEFCFASKKENYIVCRIIETALSTLSQSEIDNAVNNNLHRVNRFTFSEFFRHNILRVLIIAASLAAIVILVLLKNKRIIHKKQKEIDKVKKEMKKHIKENSDYKKKAEFDHLTGVCSRGHFLELAKNKIDGHRPNDILQLVMMDIDNFKSVNDTYGHDNGDVVLKRLGEILCEISRVNGFAGRFGGEEFLVFLYGEKAEIQEHIISQVCRKLKETDFDFTDRHITMSVGVTRIKDGDTPEACIERADKALYYSKKHGKDQVNWYEDLIDKL